MSSRAEPRLQVIRVPDRLLPVGAAVEELVEPAETREQRVPELQPGLVRDAYGDYAPGLRVRRGHAADVQAPALLVRPEHDRLAVAQERDGLFVSGEKAVHYDALEPLEHVHAARVAVRHAEDGAAGGVEDGEPRAAGAVQLLHYPVQAHAVGKAFQYELVELTGCQSAFSAHIRHPRLRRTGRAYLCPPAALRCSRRRRCPCPVFPRSSLSCLSRCCGAGPAPPPQRSGA